MAAECPKCHFENPDDTIYCGKCATPLKSAEEISITKTLITPKERLKKGSTIAGKYQILEELGRGGMGVVYKAEDTKLKRTIALKFLPPELTHILEVKERFMREAQAVAALDHPNICTVYEFDEAEEKTYISMAYIEGQSLKKKIESGSLELDDGLRLATQVAEGLQEAHKKGVVHRDIKSANIMVTEKGQAKIMDFGLARITGGTLLTQEGTTMGTIAYMSPEQARGEEVDHRTDIWSFGVVLYEMFSGQLPFKGEYDQAIIYSILKEKPRPITDLSSEIPTSIEQVIGKALEKDLDDRYQHIDELIEDLRSISAGIVPEKIKARLRKDKLRKRKKPILYAGAAGLVIIAAVLALMLFTGRGEEIESIAVLPLENLSGDPTQEIFVNGMHEALITELSKISALKVISRPSVIRFKNSEKPLPEIAETLKVKGIIAGSAWQEEERVRISVQLIDAKTEQNLWADNYDMDYQDILMLHSEVARTVAQKLKIELTPNEKTSLNSVRTVDPEAHRAYSLGRHIRESEISLKGQKKAIELFEKALAIDSDYADAYVGLSSAWFELAWSILPRTQVKAREEAKNNAREMAQRAIEIDDTLSQAHSKMALIYYYFDWNWEGAEVEFRKALELNPNDSESHQAYSEFLMGMLRHDEAIREAKRAEELDPLSPWMSEKVGECLYYARRTEQAVQKLTQVLEGEPDHFYTTAMLGWCYWDLGKLEEAQKMWSKMHALSGNQELAEAFTELSIKEATYIWLAQAKSDTSSPWYANSTLIGVVHATLGEVDEAMEWLEKAYVERDPQMPLLRIWTALDILRDDPRYKDLVRRMNFPGVE
jgi:serine/threonine-protein kinase